jgi:hypothetical protein
MAKTTTQFTIGEGEDLFWYVYEYGNKHAVFTNQAQAEYWCTINDIEFTVL